MSVQTTKAVGYLKFLDPEGVYSLKLEDMDLEDIHSIEPTPINTPEDCILCLSALLEAGVWPGYLFQNGKVWSIYIKSISEERFFRGLDLVMTAGGPLDFMLYLRACYRMGYPAIPDQEYDNIERFYIATFPVLSCLNETTQDDDILPDLVKEAIRLSGSRGSKTATVPRVDLGGDYNSLNQDKSTSIMPVRTYQEVFDFLLKAPSCPTHWSLKVDGVNTKCQFDHGLSIALSRGRASDSWDYTEAVRRIFKMHGWDGSSLIGKLVGETIVDVSAMSELQLKYSDKEYKSPKSLAGAMLRAPQSFEEEDYKYLTLYPFEFADLPKDQAFAKLAECNIVTPPAKTFRADAIPMTSVEKFSEWLDVNVLDPLWEESQQRQIGTDGVVLQLLTDEESERADKYSDLNVALKFSHWTEAVYESVVTNILFEQRRVEMSVVLEIEPVTTRDLNVATRVSVGSPAILVADGIRVGSTIAFARKSEAINIYLGKR